MNAAEIDSILPHIAGNSWEEPLAHVGPEGDHAREWWQDDRKLEIYVDAIGSASYTKIWGAGEVCEGPINGEDDLSRLWNWLKGLPEPR